MNFGVSVGQLLWADASRVGTTCVGVRVTAGMLKMVATDVFDDALEFAFDSAFACARRLCATPSPTRPDSLRNAPAARPFRPSPSQHPQRVRTLSLPNSLVYASNSLQPLADT